MKKSLKLVLIINLIIVTYWLTNNSYFPVHDFTAGARVFELTQSLKDGHLPPRWSQNFGFGMGMPLFQFYAPLVFYLASILNIFGLSILLSLKAVYLISSLIGFIGAYLLGKKLINHHGGLITATAFTLAPYHALNIYVRGATAEYVALSFTPLSLYFAFNLVDKTKLKKSYLGLVLSLVAIYLSHNVTILTFMPFWFLIVFAYALIKSKPKKIFINLLAQLHSLLISAYFLIPAFFQKSQTSAETLTQGFSQYNLHFLYFRQLLDSKWGYGGSVLGIDDQMSFYIGLDLILLTIISGATLLKQKSQKTKLFLLFLFYFFLSIFATNFKSLFLWKIIPLANYIQFPWRFLGVSSLILATLSGFSMLSKQLKKHWFVILSIIIVLNGRFFRPEKLIDPGEIYNPNPNYIQTRMSGVMPDYLPSGVNWQEQEPPQKLIEATNSDTKINITKNTTDLITATITTTKDDSITINRYYFPNWQVSINKKTEVCQKTQDSLYTCQLQAGQSDLKVKWQEKGINAYSNLISVLAIGGLILLLKLKSSK